MRVTISKGSPDLIRIGDIVVGDHWGIETADRGSFVSSTEGGWNNHQTVVENHIFDDAGRAVIDVTMSESHHLLTAECAIAGNAIARKISATTLQAGVFQDFVCRFRFDARHFPTGQIAGRTLEHKGSNVWHQFPVHEASVLGPLGSFEVKATDWETADLFTLQCYLRDEPTGLWILHLRMMPIREDLFWIRWQNRFGDLKVTGRAAKVLLRNQRLRKALWYYAERHGGRPNIQAQPLAVVPAATSISIASVATFIPKA